MEGALLTTELLSLRFVDTINSKAGTNRHNTTRQGSCTDITQVYNEITPLTLPPPGPEEQSVELGNNPLGSLRDRGSQLKLKSFYNYYNIIILIRYVVVSMT